MSCSTEDIKNLSLPLQLDENQRPCTSPGRLALRVSLEPTCGAQGRAVLPQPCALLATGAPVMATRHSAAPLSIPDKPGITPHHTQQLTNPGLRGAHHACAVVAPVLTSGLGEVTRSHRKLGSRATQNSEMATEFRSRYPGNARSTGSAPAYLRNRGEAGGPTQTAPLATEKAAACGEPAPLPRACAVPRPSALHACSIITDPRSKEPTEVFPHQVLSSSDFLPPPSGWLTWSPPCPALQLPGPRRSIIPDSLPLPFLSSI